VHTIADEGEMMYSVHKHGSGQKHLGQLSVFNIKGSDIIFCSQSYIKLQFLSWGTHFKLSTFTNNSFIATKRQVKILGTIKSSFQYFLLLGHGSGNTVYSDKK